MTCGFAWIIERHGSVGSTMDLAAERAAAGAPEGSVIVADYQSAGRGRAGRPWVAPAGSALLSTVVLRPPLPAHRLAALSLVAGVALAEAVEAETGLACWLKWPNDLWLGERHHGRKAAGILVTTRLGAAGVDYVLVGLGLNVAGARDDLPPGATSLAAELAAAGRSAEAGALGAAFAASPDHLLRPLLDRLGARYAAFVATGGCPPLDPWLRRAALLGEPVEVVNDGITRRGRFAGLRLDGALVLRAADGKEVPIVAGDLVRGPRPLPPRESG